jgi:hypothetical protein
MPQASDQVGKNAVSRDVGNQHVKGLIRLAGMGAGCDDPLHLMDGLLDLGQVSVCGANRGLRGHFSLDEKARMQKFEGAGTSVDHGKQQLASIAYVSSGAGADLHQSRDL